jgi:hypothetical protein
MNYTTHCAKVQAIHHFGNQPTIFSGTQSARKNLAGDAAEFSGA